MKPLNNLLCGQSDVATSHFTWPPKNGNQVAGYAALHAHSLPVYFENMPWRSLRGALHIDLLATAVKGFK